MTGGYETRLYKAGIGMTGSEIKIDASKLEFNLQNKMIAVPKPVSPANQETTTPTMILKDLKRFDQVITLTGALITGSETFGGSTFLVSAQNRFDALAGTSSQSSNPCFNSSQPSQGILFTGGDLLLYHKGTNYTVNIDKIQLIDDCNAHEDSPGKVNVYDVIMTFKVGSQV